MSSFNKQSVCKLQQHKIYASNVYGPTLNWDQKKSRILNLKGLKGGICKMEEEKEKGGKVEDTGRGKRRGTWARRVERGLLTLPEMEKQNNTGSLCSIMQNCNCWTLNAYCLCCDEVLIMCWAVICYTLFGCEKSLLLSVLGFLWPLFV